MDARKTPVGLVAAVALAASVAAAITPAAGARADAQTVGRFNCAIKAVNGSAGIRITTSASGVSVSTGHPSTPTSLLRITRGRTFYKLGAACRAIKGDIVFSQHGLSKSPGYSTVGCSTPARIWMRLVSDIDRTETPTSARIEIIRPHAPGTPLGQVYWLRARSTTYFRLGPCSVQR